jgi:hypothetical protein
LNKFHYKTKKMEYHKTNKLGQAEKITPLKIREWHEWNLMF